jgi:hypothetical protein
MSAEHERVPFAQSFSQCDPGHPDFINRVGAKVRRCCSVLARWRQRFIFRIMSKTPKAKNSQWSVYKLAKATRHIGHVMAPDEKAALARAFEELEIREQDRFRITVRPGY